MGVAWPRASAQASFARMVRSACRRTRSSPRTRRGSNALVLEPAELALDGGAAPVGRLPALRRAGHQRVKTVRIDPAIARGTFAYRAPPLGRSPSCVGTSEPPLAMFARRRSRLPGLDHRRRVPVPSRPRRVSPAGRRQSSTSVTAERRQQKPLSPESRYAHFERSPMKGGQHFSGLAISLERAKGVPPQPPSSTRLRAA